MDLKEISVQLQAGKAKIVKTLVQQAIDEGIPAQEILEKGLLDGMNEVGEKFKNNEIFVPEVLVAARAMNQGVSLLKPLLQQEGVKATGRVCIGTVQGDLHDIGKNLVKMMMEGKGLEVIDLGTDVSADTFVQTAIEQHCDIICCSALLTTTMGVMGDVVKAAEAAVRRQPPGRADQPRGLLRGQAARAVAAARRHGLLERLAPLYRGGALRGGKAAVRGVHLGRKRRVCGHGARRALGIHTDGVRLGYDP